MLVIGLKAGLTIQTKTKGIGPRTLTHLDRRNVDVAGSVAGVPDVVVQPILCGAREICGEFAGLQMRAVDPSYPLAAAWQPFRALRGGRALMHQGAPDWFRYPGPLVASFP